jgi:adenylate cyclase
MSFLAASYYFERDYEKAVAVARRSLVHYPDYPRAHRWLAAAFGQLGRTGEARAALNELKRVSSTALGLYARSRRIFLLEDQEHLLDGLRKAGWQG